MPASKATAADKAAAGKTAESKADNFDADEKAAMKDRAREARAARNRKGEEGRKADLDDVLQAISAMDGTDREIGENLHGLIVEVTDLAPKTWYGMPAYARDGKVVAFFQPAGKFKARYATLGFDSAAQLDDGDMWPASYAITAWNAGVAERVAELLRRAVG